MEIEITNLYFSYKHNPIFEDVSLNIKLENDCLVLMGHNGAGKTTLLNLICDILSPKSGNIHIDTNSKLAYLPFESNLYPHLTVIENIRFWYTIYNNAPLDEKNPFLLSLITSLKLEDLLHTKAILLSSGEEKKVSFLIILLSNANLMILDEPFNGIDPISVLEITDVLQQMKEKGVNFIITSHQLELLEKVATQYIIMKNHKVAVYERKRDGQSFYNLYKDIYLNEDEEDE